MVEFLAILACSPSSYVFYVFQLKHTWVHKSFFVVVVFKNIFSYRL